ncbi:MAG TPA: SMP-30/gluconolactonase/LRE family protein [Spirochaetia bacterium]|nr:SMP-30/gluconolactonase/LRE family protein [Spirochaetia bacterium]
MNPRTPSPIPELLADYHCVCGEIPLWHPEERRVYWSDIPAGRLFRYDPATGRHEEAFQGEPVGGMTLQKDGSLLLLMDRCQVCSWKDGALRPVVEKVPPGEEKARWNDAIADPEGRVYAGTLPSEGHKGSLYRLDPDGTYTRLVEGFGCSNGMGFTGDLRRFYHVDSTTRHVYLYDYQRATGAITNQRVFATLAASLGVPDGMTVDAKGFVWVAVWGGSCVIRFSPNGEEDQRVYFTGKLVSCPTFGGEDYRDLYVTLAGGEKKDVNGPGAGALFRVRPGVKGVPEFRSRIGL